MRATAKGCASRRRFETRSLRARRRHRDSRIDPEGHVPSRERDMARKLCALDVGLYGGVGCDVNLVDRLGARRAQLCELAGRVIKFGLGGVRCWAEGEVPESTGTGGWCKPQSYRALSGSLQSDANRPGTSTSSGPGTWAAARSRCCRLATSSAACLGRPQALSSRSLQLFACRALRKTQGVLCPLTYGACATVGAGRRSPCTAPTLRPARS